MSETHVLISNDDGIEAFGLRALEAALADLPGVRTTTVAPATQQSATGRCMTLSRPLRVKAHGPARWSVSGTPTDTVMVALAKILRDDPPDFVIAGINHGPNMGEDVHYSGTVAAAMEGCVQGLPAAAVSLADWHPCDFGAAAAFVRRMLPEMLGSPLPRGTMWNINVPDGDEDSLKGYRVTRQGSRIYHDVINDLADPRGRPLVWIAGKGPTWAEHDETDYLAVRDGYASMTPLHIDLTNHQVWQDHAHRGGEVPGVPAFAGDGDRFVLRRETSQGLVFEGPTRGGDTPIAKVQGDVVPEGGKDLP